MRALHPNPLRASSARLDPAKGGEREKQAPSLRQLKPLEAIEFFLDPALVLLARSLRRAPADPVPFLHQQLLVLAIGLEVDGGDDVLAHQHRPDGTERDREILTSVGQASPRVNVRIVADEGEDLPAGSVGEILLSSPAVMKGYWNNTVATIETLRDGWVHTGDVGRLDHEGYLYLVDRKKDMIISGGENISSREVEEAVVLHEAVQEVAVAAVTDGRGFSRLRAFVVPVAAPADGLSDDLVALARDRLAAFKVPRSVSFVPSLPRTSTGKLRRHLVRQGAW